MRWWCSTCGKALAAQPDGAALSPCSCGSSSRQSWPRPPWYPPGAGNAATSGAPSAQPRE